MMTKIRSGFQHRKNKLKNGIYTFKIWHQTSALPLTSYQIIGDVQQSCTFEDKNVNIS